MAESKHTNMNPLADVTLGEFLDKADKSNSEVAPSLYNPGYVDADDIRDDYLQPTDGIQDLKKEHRETLALFAAKYQKTHNKYHSNTATTVSTAGHARGDVIDNSSQDQEGPNRAHFNDIDTPGVQNFNSLSGGTSANATLGSFFSEAQLASIITKDHSNETTPLGPFDGNDVNRLLPPPPDTTTDDTTVLQPKLTTEIEDVLHNTNRYSPKEGSTPYIKDHTTQDETKAYSKGLWSVQSGYRDDSKTIQDGFGKYKHNAEQINVEDLRRMALATLTAAQGWADVITPDTAMKDLIYTAENVWQASRIELGFGRIDVNTTRIGQTAVAMAKSPTSGSFNSQGEFIQLQAAKETFGSGPDGPVDGLSAPINASSFGGMNSFAEWFDGPMPMGMMVISLYGMVSLGVIGGLLGMIGMGESKAKSQVPVDPNSPRTLAMGASQPAGQGQEILQMFMKQLGVYIPSSNWAGCLGRGMSTFYGLPVPIHQINLKNAMDVLVNLMMAPGYYAVITKQVLRDVTQITKAFEGFSVGMGFNSGLTQFFRVIEALFSSTTFRFINTMVMIGDQSYRSLYDYGGIAHKGASVVKYQDEEGVTLNPVTRMSSQSRFQVGGAWVGKYSLNTFGSILLPNSITDRLSDSLEIYRDKGAKSPIGKEINADALAGEGGRAKWISTGLEKTRISADTVKIVEEQLDEEYVPFYIHDVRTNEIIAMPAFVSSVSDSFSADYSDSHGYGRTDPVKIYGSTTRSIDLTFKLAAMSTEDHKYMWYIINKLVTMMYPQRSLGRMRISDDGKKGFIQPFSQVPTASPLVRIRLGDLLASNYTSRNFGRIFGYPSHYRDGDDKIDLVKETQASFSTINDLRPEFLVKVNSEFKQELKKLIDDADAMNTPAVGDLQNTTTSVILHGGLIFSMPEGKADEQSLKTYAILPNQVEGKITKVFLAEKYKGDIAGASSASGIKPKEMTTLLEIKINLSKLTGAQHPITALGGTSLRAAMGNTAPTDITIYVDLKASINKISITPTELDARVNEAMKSAVDTKVPSGSLATGEKYLDNFSKFQTFMQPAKNPLVKSFENSRGRGLAGFITQMSLGYDGAPWETKKTQRAPQYVEITMSFSPIHDLPLGLDHRGRIIAPSHPVGLAHTNPWVGIEGAPADESQANPNQQAVLQKNSIDAVNENAATKEDPAKKAAAQPQIPPAPPTSGLNPATLGLAMAALGKVKDVL